MNADVRGAVAVRDGGAGKCDHGDGDSCACRANVGEYAETSWAGGKREPQRLLRRGVEAPAGPAHAPMHARACRAHCRCGYIASTPTHLVHSVTCNTPLRVSASASFARRARMDAMEDRLTARMDRMDNRLDGMRNHLSAIDATLARIAEHLGLADAGE